MSFKFFSFNFVEKFVKEVLKFDSLVHIAKLFIF